MRGTNRQIQSQGHLQVVNCIWPDERKEHCAEEEGGDGVVTRTRERARAWRRRCWIARGLQGVADDHVANETRGHLAALQCSLGREDAQVDGGQILEQTEARRAGVDLVLLDLLMPKMDGIEVLIELRATHPSLSVIILTARGGEDDRVQGLRRGADDYVVKPFSARELLARVEAVLRRSPERPNPVLNLSAGAVTVDC